MTFQEKAIQLCYERGMFRKDAEAVAAAVMKDPANEAMQGRWQDDVSGYPPQMLAVLWFTVKRHALAHIESTCPLAWYKPLFEDGDAAPASTH